MTKQTEALKMAIAVLEQDVGWSDGGNGFEEAVIALKACKDALEQPAQEPMAWMSSDGIITKLKSEAQLWVIKGGSAIPLYTHPAPSWQGNKEFVGLSDDERFIIVQNADWDNPYDIAELIEQALKEKNT